MWIVDSWMPQVREAVTILDLDVLFQPTPQGTTICFHLVTAYPQQAPFIGGLACTNLACSVEMEWAV